MAASLAAVREISVNAALATVLSELVGIFVFKKNRMANKVFLGVSDVFALLLTSFAQSLARGSDTRLMSPPASTGSFKLLPVLSNHLPSFASTLQALSMSS